MWCEIALTLLIALTFARTAPTEENVKAPIQAEDLPQYEYKYAVNLEKDRQGKEETRDGEHAEGRYYIEGSQSSQTVQYVVDDSGYHPYVKYSTSGPHSQFSAEIALDTGSVNVKNNQGQPIPQLNTNHVNEKESETVLQEETSTVPIPQRDGRELQVEDKTTTEIIEEKPTSLPLLSINSPNLPFADKDISQLDASSSIRVPQVLSFDGQFGAKLNPKIPRKPFAIERPSFVSQDNFEYRPRKPSKLIENTRNLVSGQDVLNLNGAIDPTIPTEMTETTSTFLTEEPTEKGPDQKSLLEDPIVVEDVTEVNSNGIQLSTKSIPEKPEQILVTPRPVSSNFLAPITAGVRLESDQKPEHQKQKIVVEILKSLPYYLGKFEYIHTPEGLITKNPQFNVEPTKEIPTNVVKDVSQHIGEESIRQESVIKEDQNSVSNLDLIVKQSDNKQPLLPPIHFSPVWNDAQLSSLQPPVPVEIKATNNPLQIETQQQIFLQPPPKPAVPQLFHYNPFALTPQLFQAVIVPFNFAPNFNQDFRHFLRPPVQQHLNFQLPKPILVNRFLNPRPYVNVRPQFNYYNLLPQKVATVENEVALKKHRQTRENFGKNLRIEYGFKPPLRPSLEIDEYGNPV